MKVLVVCGWLPNLVESNRHIKLFLSGFHLLPQGNDLRIVNFHRTCSSRFRKTRDPNSGGLDALKISRFVTAYRGTPNRTR